MNGAFITTVQYESTRRAVHRASNPLPAWIYPAFWLAWVLLAIGVEFYALFNKQPGDTLSEQWWRYITGQRHPIGEPAWAVWIGRAVILAFCAWLGPHLAFGIWA